MSDWLSEDGPGLIQLEKKVQFFEKSQFNSFILLIKQADRTKSSSNWNGELYMKIEFERTSNV